MVRKSYNPKEISIKISFDKELTNKNFQSKKIPHLIISLTDPNFLPPKKRKFPKVFKTLFKHRHTVYRHIVCVTYTFYIHASKNFELNLCTHTHGI